jgi:hypothetical protein
LFSHIPQKAKKNKEWSHMNNEKTIVSPALDNGFGASRQRVELKALYKTCPRRHAGSYRNK